MTHNNNSLPASSASFLWQHTAWVDPGTALHSWVSGHKVPSSVRRAHAIGAPLKSSISGVPELQGLAYTALGLPINKNV